MGYTVLARRYRPLTFADLLGQEDVVRTLTNAIKSGRVAHAYLFHGPRGVGKTTVARILAKALNCEQGITPEPCGECVSCEEITTSRSMDVHEIDGASHTGVDHIRELKEVIIYPPARDRHKIFIIDEVHMLSTSAFNALLKTLEEPPPHAIFIFATTERQKIPATILSRCQQFAFRPIPHQMLVDHLRHILDSEEVEAGDTTLHRIARSCDGCVRDALSLLDQLSSLGAGTIEDDDVAEIMGETPVEVIGEILSHALDGERAALWSAIQERTREGVRLPMLYEGAIGHLREALAICLQAPSAHLLPEEKNALEMLTNTHEYETLLRAYNFLLTHQQLVTRAESPSIVAELVLLKLAELPRLTALESMTRDGGNAAPAEPETTPRAGTETDPNRSSLAGFHAEMERNHPPLAGYIHAARVEYEGTDLRFTFSPENAACFRRIREPLNWETVLSVARRYLGEDVSVDAVLDENREPSDEEHARPDPTVQRVATFFQGKITDVRRERTDDAPAQEETT